MSSPKIDYELLEVGYELPPAKYFIDKTDVSAYLKAVGETSHLYFQPDKPHVLAGLAPSAMLAASVIANLSQTLSLPPGTIHTTQEIEWFKPLLVGSQITCCFKISRKVKRSNLYLLAVDFSCYDENKALVLSGTSGFALPGAIKNS